jgi:hypothetical protein
MMTEKLEFVQFLHPSSEHSSGEWNTGEHKRRFIKNIGSYVEGEQVKQNDLIFWCEWEAQAEKIRNLHHFEKADPRYLWQPYYKPENTSNLQNTDPFVFGSHFYYVCCQQWKNQHPTQLRFLKKGSVILFGSNLDSHFVLDTVFVVGESQVIQSLKDIPKGVSKTYKDVTLNLTVQNRCKPAPTGCSDSWTPPDYNLYSGATYENPVDGMFSFFPCLPYVNQERGFKRPIIQIDNLITQNLALGFKLNEQSSIEQCKDLWCEVKKQVEDAGLKLGVYAELPPEKNIMSAAA